LRPPGQGPGYTLRTPPGAKPFAPRGRAGSAASSTPGCHRWSR